MRFPGIRGFGVLAAAALAGGLFTAPVAAAAVSCAVSDEMVAAGNYWAANGTNPAPEIGRAHV